jgi:arylsulfatase A-like enzyme
LCYTEWMRNLRDSLFFLVVLLILACSFACKGKAPLNFLLITLDTQRADYIGCYGEGKADTPHLDSLAERGILFTRSYSLIPITLPAHAAILYSLPPHQLHIYNNGQLFEKSEGGLSLAAVFQANKFSTAGFVSLGVLKSKFGLSEGFDVYEDSFSPGRWYLHAEEINQKVFSWLKENKDNPFFLWVHYSDPHDPYAPPSTPQDMEILVNGKSEHVLTLRRKRLQTFTFTLAEGENTVVFRVLNPFPDKRDDCRASLNDVIFDKTEGLDITYDGIEVLTVKSGTSFLVKKEGTMRIFNPGPERKLRFTTRGNLNLLDKEKIKGYREEVEYMDFEIGKLIGWLEHLGLFDRTAILVVGDHGEGLGEYKTHFGHIHFLYEVYMRIPMILYDPLSNERGLKVSIPVSLIDVAPTALSLMGWKKRPSYRGRNLLDLKGENPFIFQETYKPESFFDRFAGIHYPWHLIYTPGRQEFELFHLADDPGEKYNVYASRKFSAETVDLRQKVQALARSILSGKPEPKLDKKSTEMLKSLGYIR